MNGSRKYRFAGKDAYGPLKDEAQVVDITDDKTDGRFYVVDFSAVFAHAGALCGRGGRFLAGLRRFGLQAGGSGLGGGQGFVF